jgi:hypothetical protein
MLAVEYVVENIMHTTIYYSSIQTNRNAKCSYIKEYEVDSYDESTLYCKRRNEINAI